MKSTDIENMQAAIRSMPGRCGVASRSLLLLGMLLLSNAAHAYSVTASPATCASVAGVGTIAWTNPGNALASDNVYATAANVIRNTTTNYLECTGYGFSIPAGATISGITVYVERKTSGGTIRDAAMRVVKAGVIGTTDLSTTTNYATTDVVEAHGSSANLWGTTWTPADINAANFGAAFAAKNTSTTSTTNRTVSVDQIWITVDFAFAGTLPAGTWGVTANPGSCQNVTGIGTIAWTPSPTANVNSSDNVYATAANVIRNTTTNYLECTGYNFAIPTGAAINGITVFVERKTSGGTIHDAAMRLVKAGVIGTTDLSTTTNYTTTDFVEVHGSMANLWGTTWTPADINAANFGAAFAALNTSTTSTTNRTVSVDYMPITVTFTVTAILNPGDFNTYDSSTAPAGALDGVITTKVAGQSFSLDIAALNLAKTALLTTYTQTVKVELLDASLGGLLDANNCNGSWTLIQTLPNQTFTGSTTGAGTDVTVTGSAGRHRVVGIVENNAWRNVAVRVSYPATGSATSIGCSTDHFAIRPASFSGLSVTDTDWQTAGTARALTNTAASGGVTHKSGQPFTVQATAVNAAAATTTKYASAPTVVASACGGTACIGTPDVLTVTAASGGVINSTTTYSDVGSFNIQLQDTTFAQVDASDGTPADCTGQYVCSSALAIGRFVPDHYSITFDPTNARLVNRSDIAACEIATTGDIAAATTALTVASATGFAVGDQIIVAGAGSGGDDLLATITAIAGTAVTLGTAASSDVAGAAVQKAGFTYMDEQLSLGFTIEAHNLSDSITQNYTGALAKLNLAAPASFGFAAADGSNYFLTSDRLSLISSSGAWIAGAADVTVTLGLSSLPNATSPRTGAADGPYNNLYFGVNASDADGVGMLATDYDLNTDATAGFDHVMINSVPAQVRFGRLKLSNAYGSQLLDLPIPIVTQYWNGTAFVTNAADNCTSVAPSLVPSYQGNLRAANMGSGHISPGGSFVNGVGNLKLTKPSPAANGSVDVTVNLAGAGMSYLQGNWTTTAFTGNPTARANFGIYGAQPNQFLYFRENH